jgi:hypothetical protein
MVESRSHTEHGELMGILEIEISLKETHLSLLIQNRTVVKVIFAIGLWLESIVKTDKSRYITRNPTSLILALNLGASTIFFTTGLWLESIVKTDKPGYITRNPTSLIVLVVNLGASTIFLPFSLTLARPSSLLVQWRCLSMVVIKSERND